MIKVIALDESLKPAVGSAGAAGFDLRLSTDVVIKSNGGVVKVGTGLKFEIPEGFVGLVVPRSGIPDGLELVNTIGVIDSDYQGEIFLKIKNTGRETFLGYKGDRYFQLVIVSAPQHKLMYVTSFGKITERGEKGFNSSGLL